MTSEAFGAGNLRARARDMVREQVIAIAWELFAAQGFEATTVDQVAEAAGMSRRSFFRYFAGKEDLVAGRMHETASDVVAALAARPLDEPLWVAIRAGLEPLVQLHDGRPERARSLLVMLREPPLRASLQERRERWRTLLGPEIARRLPAGDNADSDPRVAAVIGAAVACFEAAQTAWIADPVPGFGAHLDRALAVVAGG